MNPIPLAKTPTVEGQLAVNGNVVSTMVGTTVVPLTSGDVLPYGECDTGYFGMDNIPITRVGDNTYLPMDVKADFRGAIQPWAQVPYFLQEADGSVTALRPGYNGEFTRTFYAYSQSGSYDPADFRLTDSEYRPSWLAADEYVSNILDGNEHGLLVRIRSTVDLTEQRYYWIDHNNTLDSRFHKFLDVTANMLLTPPGAANFLTPAAIGGGGYIPEANLFVTSATNNINAFCYIWAIVDRPFQTVRSATIPNALPAKNVDWQDLSGTVAGTTSTSIVMDASTAPKEALYWKYIGDPATRLGGYYTHPSSGRRQMTYAYDAGVVRLFTAFFAYIPYAGNQNQFGWSCHMDYNVAANTLRYTPVTNDPQRFQTLPWVVRWNTAVDEAVPPGSGGDNYKANKFPMSYGRNAAFQWGNALVKVQCVGDKLVTHYCGTSNADFFGAQATNLSDYTGATLAAKKMDALRRPYYMRTVNTFKTFIPYDASILSKALNHVSFIGDNILRGVSNSKLYGQELTTKPFLAYLPATTTTGTVYSTDSNSYKSCLPTPTTVVPASANYSLSSMTSYIDGNGAMVVSRASWSSIDSTAANWLRVNINPSTGIAALSYAADPTTFRSKMTEVTAATIAQSTFKPSAAYDNATSLQPIVVIGTNAYFLYCLAFGNASEGVKFEYATLVLPIVGGNVVWPATATAAVISRVTGQLVTPASNTLGPQYFVDWEGLGVYRHTDGNYYVFVSPPTFVSTVGGNYGEQRIFKLNSSLGITATTLTAGLSSWLGVSCGVHPKFGLYSTNIWNDSSAKCMMYYNDFTGVTDQASRLYQAAEKWLAGTGGQQTTFILSSKSASGFVLYCSEIQVMMNGKVGVIPTQTIQLVSVVADPSNKVFYCYVQWTGTGFVLTPSLTTVPESATSTFVGVITTNATGITSNTIQKVTRLDNYRLYSSAPIIGSAIRAYQNQPAIQAYVYDTTAEVNTFKATHVPPAPSAVFNTWDRTNATAYFPGGVGATGDAAAWTFATNPDRVVQPNNTAAWASFISPQSYDNYEFETTLGSTNADDDVIGMTAAFARVGGTANLQLIVARTCGGWAQQQGNAAAQAHNFAFNVEGTTLPAGDKPKLQAKLIGANRSNGATPAGPGWAGIFTRIRVVRRGNVITAYCSDWSTDRANVPILESSVIELDMTTIPALAPLLNTAPYGYTTISQAQATYYDTTFSGGLDTGRVVDLQTNTVWKYNFSSSSWTAAAITPKDELGYVRTVSNPDTGKTYFVTQDAVIKQ